MLCDRDGTQRRPFSLTIGHNTYPLAAPAVHLMAAIQSLWSMLSPTYLLSVIFTGALAMAGVGGAGGGAYSSGSLATVDLREPQASRCPDSTLNDLFLS